MSIVIAILILLAYTLYMIREIGRVPSSLSASVFWIPEKLRYVWSLVILAVCYLCIPVYIGRTTENTQFLAFLAIAGLAFVGAAPLVKYRDDAMQFKVHEWGAIVCASCSQLVLVFNCPLLLLLWIPYVIAGFIIGWKKWETMIFWGEMVCFSNTFAFCLI